MQKQEKKETLDFSRETINGRVEALLPESSKEGEKGREREGQFPIERISDLEDDVKSFEKIVSLAEKKTALRAKMLEISLKATSYLDWIDQDGAPYLMASGCETLADIWGISLVQKDPPQKIWTEDEKGKYYIYIQRGTFKKGDRMIIAEGKCSQRDSFFGTWTEWVKDKDGKIQKITHIKPLSEIREEDVIQAAYSNLFANGVKRILGIRNITYEMLKNAGIDITKIIRIERKPKTEDQELQQKKEKIIEFLKNKTGGDENLLKNEIRKITTWTDKDGNIHAGLDSLENASKKRVDIIYSKIFNGKEEKK